MENYIINLIIGGVISWTILFMFIRKIFPDRSFEFCNRIVSSVHATLAVILASLSVEDWMCPVCPMASKASHSQMQALAVTFAYMVYDLVCCQFDKRITLDNTIHHLVSIAGIAACLAYQKCGSEVVGALWVTEISSPFLHWREIIKELGYKDTGLNLIADISFAVAFTFGRMVCGPYLSYVTLSADNPFLIKVTGLGLQLVSVFWFFKIVRMVGYKLAKWNSKKLA